ncbi:MAG: Signal transduction histidine kinase [Candidatus Lokiarchaeum sp. GC14_75]|nr:MAG: Signal transduction histidine kinase [Candidatus Lokiarchaeum sp. GC14_75]
MTKKSLIEQTLKEPEEKYRKLFQQYKMLVDSTTDSVYVLNRDWNYILVNEAAAKLLKLTVDEILNKNLIDLLPGIEETPFFKVYDSVMETKKMDRIFNEFTFPDGRYGVYEVSVYPITEGILCIARDITEEKEIEGKLKKSEEKYRNLSNQYEMLLESITDSVFALNSDWEYILVNKSAENINNLSRDKIIGNKMQDLFPGIEDTPFFKIYESVMNNRNEERIIESFTHPDGKTRFYDLSVYPIHQGILCISKDVTEEREIQQELEESEEKYRKSFYRANLYKNIFAHDINNILQNIYSSVELSSLYINNPEKLHTIKELYDIINEQVNRGKKLINNVSKITEIDETETILEKTEVHLILNRAVEYLKNSFQTRNIEVQITSSTKKIYVMVNKLLLDVFENILINAVRHNNNTNINIIITISRIDIDSKNSVQIEFKDNGIGISAFRKKGIFQKGTRKNQKSKGMGLGLSLVKKIIDSYHGEIRVEDRIKGDYKQGSNFILLIPEAL